MMPFDVPTKGLPFDFNSITTYSESSDGITVISSTAPVGVWYLLIALYDEYNNPIGYIDPTIEVVDINKVPTILTN
jgi:hypothetical protein